MVLANKISRLYLFCLIGLLLASSASAAGKKLISITVTPSVLNAAIGKTQQFKATGYFSDGSAQDLTSSVVWNSSSPAVAVITSSGLATILGPGNSTITAQVAGG